MFNLAGRFDEPAEFVELCAFIRNAQSRLHLWLEPADSRQ
jgi:hypothetical protein